MDATLTDRYGRLVRLATAYDGDDGDGTDEVSIEVPDDLTDVADDRLAELRGEINDTFAALYDGGDADLTSDEVDALEALADEADRIEAEQDRRAEDADARRARADDIAARMAGDTDDGHGEDPEASSDDDPEAEDADDSDAEDDGDDPDADAETDDDPEADTDDGDGGDVTDIDDARDDGGESDDDGDAEPVAAASGPTTINVNLGDVRSRQSRDNRGNGDDGRERVTMRAAADLRDFSAGQEIDSTELAQIVERRAQAVPEDTIRRAAESGQRFRQQYGLATIVKDFPDELRLDRADNPDEVIRRAVDESRLPDGSLVAAGGWCAPSETLYELVDPESTDGIISLPEVMANRGGFRYTVGPDFSTLFTNSGFNFTEAEDESGDAHPKNCYHVECPTFTNERLEVDGVCIRAGILQRGAYPELVERVVDGSLVAHEHSMATRMISTIATASTPATGFGGTPDATTAPVLEAIELQVEDMRYKNRRSRTETIEAIFPYWIRGAIRADLARRLGVDLISVTDQRIRDWFAQRQVSVQFVYNYQNLGGEDPAAGWPSTVDFLLYPAGTWVRATSELVTLDALFDSNLYQQNDYTAIFTEEGWALLKQNHDSREVTVDIGSDGATHAGVDITPLEA